MTCGCSVLSVQELTQRKLEHLASLKASIVLAKQQARLAGKKHLEGKYELQASNAWKH